MPLYIQIALGVLLGLFAFSAIAGAIDELGLVDTLICSAVACVLVGPIVWLLCHVLGFA